MNDEKERYAHPSFGQISFSRVTGHAYFYGSELRHDNYIEMKVNRSECDRDLTRDWYYEKERVLVLRMTTNQFSEMITNMNASGIPCTLTNICGKEVEAYSHSENRKELVHRQFKERMDNFALTLKEKQELVKRLTAKKTLSAKDQKQLNWAMDWITQARTRNMPYFTECFQETMDRVVVEAKTEVDNAIQHKINVLGLQALHEENKLFEHGKDAGND